MMNNFNDLNFNFNLLPWRDMQRQRQNKSLKIALSSALLCGMVIVGLWYFLLDLQIMRGTASLNNLQQASQTLQKQQEQRDNLRQRIAVVEVEDNFIKRIENEQTRNIEILVTLSQIISPFIYFNAIQKNAGLITVTGKTIALKALADFTQRINKASWLQRLELQEIKNSDVNYNNVEESLFILQMNLR